MKLACLSHAYPDVHYEVLKLAQVTEKSFEEEQRPSLKVLSLVVKYVIDNSASIPIPALYPSSFRVMGIFDPSFANSHNNSTQLGFISSLADQKNNTVSNLYNSYKACRIVWSVFGCELMIFSNIINFEFSLASELRRLHPLSSVLDCLFTGSKFCSKSSRKVLELQNAEWCWISPLNEKDLKGTISLTSRWSDLVTTLKC